MSYRLIAKVKQNTPAELTVAVKYGDRPAFREVYERYHKQLYFTALRYLRHREMAEDAVQDIFIKLWLKKRTLNPALSIKAFMVTCLKNHVRITGDFNRENRAVTLKGEAFFDVAHQPEKPFIIKAGASEIEVLGTSFNVKLTDNQSNVGVAVTEGKVRLAHADREKFSQSVILDKGHYGDINTENGQILTDENGIKNYLFWQNGRLVFDSMSMEEVCVQLGRIFGTACSLGDLTIKNRILTANFSSESLDKTLSVIGLSLNLRYEKEAELIHWFNK